MNAAHLHLVVNHVPILVSILSVLVLAWGMYRSNKSFQQLALIGFVVAGLFSFIAVQSGGDAEEIVEDLGGVSHNMIHEHEEAAETVNWIAVLLGVASLAALQISRSKSGINKKFLAVLLVVGTVSSGMFVYAGYLGGEIRHTEIRSNSANDSVQQPATADESPEESGES